MEELYHKSCALAEDAAEAKENFQHPTRLINFLVGLKVPAELRLVHVVVVRQVYAVSIRLMDLKSQFSCVSCF